MTHESTWSNKDYHYVHSPGAGPHDRYGGLLTMISTRLARADDIQFYAPHPGRLLHVRVHHGGTHIDILNWYQYAVSQQEGTFDRRQKLLIQLQKTVLPRRNLLLVGGDFNCPCESHGPVCGQAVVPAQSHALSGCAGPPAGLEVAAPHRAQYVVASS